MDTERSGLQKSFAEQIRIARDVWQDGNDLVVVDMDGTARVYVGVARAGHLVVPSPAVPMSDLPPGPPITPPGVLAAPT